MAPDIAALEAASYATWTADDSDVIGGWHVCAAAGLSRRVNSARDHGDAEVDDASHDALVAWFADRDLPLVIRETPLMASETSAAVRNEWGFESLDETPVMIGGAMSGATDDEVLLVMADDEAFQTELYELNGRTDGDADTLRRIYGRVADRGTGLWMPGVGAAVAVQDGPRCAVFSLAVAEPHRRQGIGTTLMTAASDWAVHRGANEVFVQVAGTNHPAIELYQSLGFEEVYRYRYLLARSIGED